MICVTFIWNDGDFLFWTLLCNSLWICSACLLVVIFMCFVFNVMYVYALYANFAIVSLYMCLLSWCYYFGLSQL